VDSDFEVRKLWLLLLSSDVHAFPASSASHVLEANDLRPNTRYTVFVVAFSDGMGMAASNAKIVTTSQDGKIACSTHARAKRIIKSYVNVILLGDSLAQ
jgi:hypothetical protein